MSLQTSGLKSNGRGRCTLARSTAESAESAARARVPWALVPQQNMALKRTVAVSADNLQGVSYALELAFFTARLPGT